MIDYLKHNFAIFCCILFLLSLNSPLQLPAQTDSLAVVVKQAREIISQRGEAYISLENQTLYDNSDLLEHLSLDYFFGQRAFLYCNTRALDMLKGRGLAFRLERSPGDVDFDLNMKDWEALSQLNQNPEWNFYPTWDAYVNMMYQFQLDFPQHVKIHNILDLPSGRSLLFAQISSDLDVDEPKPRFMYTSTIHGDETTGFILSLRLIHYLLSNYGVNDEITYLLNNLEVWICPNENPDGTYTNNNNTVSGATRSNSNGIDLNRDYPNPLSSKGLSRQPETRAMMNLTDTLSFVMSATMHGGMECVNYPWDNWLSSNRTHADQYWWQMVAHEYADTARVYSPVNYMNPSGNGFNNGVTHGGDWYVVTGGRQDFMNYYRNQRELTLELSNTKLLPAALLPAHWEYNHRSLLNYMRQAIYGIRGTVSDLHTGMPVAARVEIINHDKDNSFVYALLPHGDYYRPLLQGTYSMKVTAEGYKPFIVENIPVSNYNTTIIDVELIKEEQPDSFKQISVVRDSGASKVETAGIAH